MAERAYEFDGIKGKSNPNKLIYNFKTKGLSPQDFRCYWNPLNLFENWRDIDVKSKEVWKNQVKFKSYLREIKTGSNNSENQNSIIKNAATFLIYEKKIIQVFRDFPICR